MSPYFTQWRILGILTLALACMCMRGWLICLSVNNLNPEKPLHNQYLNESVVIPLTLFSGYMLLVKPRKKVRQTPPP